MATLIEQLKALRKKKGLKQAQLGEKLGLPQSHISSIEKGDTDPRLSTACDMARVLDHELVLVPRNLVNSVKTMTTDKASTIPLWRPDEDPEEENE